MNLELTDDEKQVLRQIMASVSPAMNRTTARVFLSLGDKVDAALGTIEDSLAEKMRKEAVARGLPMGEVGAFEAAQAMGMAGQREGLGQARAPVGNNGAYVERLATNG